MKKERKKLPKRVNLIFEEKTQVDFNIFCVKKGKYPSHVIKRSKMGELTPYEDMLEFIKTNKVLIHKLDWRYKLEEGSVIYELIERYKNER